MMAKRKAAEHGRLLKRTEELKQDTREGPILTV
jgi:hypothetical protein